MRHREHQRGAYNPAYGRDSEHSPVRARPCYPLCLQQCPRRRPGRCGSSPTDCPYQVLSGPPPAHLALSGVSKLSPRPSPQHKRTQQPGKLVRMSEGKLEYKLRSPLASIPSFLDILVGLLFREEMRRKFISKPRLPPVTTSPNI